MSNNKTEKNNDPLFGWFGTYNMFKLFAIAKKKLNEPLSEFISFKPVAALI